MPDTTGLEAPVPGFVTALDETRSAVAARDALIDRMALPSSVSSVEFNAAQDRLANAAPGLLAAVEAALSFHEMGTTWGRGLADDGRFDYCKTCSGHPAWPCPEVTAIARALEAGQ